MMEKMFTKMPYEFGILIIAIFFIAIIVLFVLEIRMKYKVKGMIQKYNLFMSGDTDKNLDQTLESMAKKIIEFRNKNKDLEKRINSLEKNIKECIQKVGIIRYSAFEDVGSDLSFSYALLDDNDNGIVISSMYARDSSFCYGKQITSGNSKNTLTVEEIQSIDLAKRIYRERIHR